MARFARIVLLGGILIAGVVTADAATMSTPRSHDRASEDVMPSPYLTRFAANDPPPGAVRVPDAQLPSSLRLVSAWRFQGSLYLVTSRPLEAGEVAPLPSRFVTDDVTKRTASIFTPAAYFPADHIELSASTSDTAK